MLFSLVSLFNGISTFVGHIMLKPSLEKSSSDTIVPMAEGMRGFIPFSSATGVWTHSLQGCSPALIAQGPPHTPYVS